MLFWRELLAGHCRSCWTPRCEVLVSASPPPQVHEGPWVTCARLPVSVLTFFLSILLCAFVPLGFLFGRPAPCCFCGRGEGAALSAGSVLLEPRGAPSSCRPANGPLRCHLTIGGHAAWARRVWTHFCSALRPTAYSSITSCFRSFHFIWLKFCHRPVFGLYLCLRNEQRFLVKEWEAAAAGGGCPEREDEEV